MKGHRVKHTEGMQGPERGGGRQAPVSTVSTQCTDETNTKRKALPPGEKGLWVHSQESQDSTPRKGQEKEVPCTQSDLPPRDKEICEDHCLWDVLLATEYSPSLQACSRHGIGSLRTKHPSERAELVLDLLSLRVKCHLYFEFSLVKPTSKWSRITCESLQVTDQLRTLSSLSYPVWLLL